MPWPGDDPAIERLFGNTWSEPVASGVDVNEDTAFNFSAYWALIQIIAGTLASLPLPVYKRLSNGGKEKAPEHFLYDLIHTSPNPDMTSFTFRETIQQHVITWGNGYAGIVYDKSGGRPKELWPLNPSQMQVKRDKRTKQLYYELTPTGSSSPVRLAKEQVFHVKGLGANGVVGYSLVHVARESLGVGLAMEQYQSRFYGNAAVPSGALELPEKMPDKNMKNLRDSLKRSQVDWANKRRPIILEGGTKWRSLAVPQEDAQFLDSRRFTIAEWARWGNVPVHLLREMTDSSVRANIEQEGREFVDYTMRPWAVRWEQEISRQLLPAADRERYFAEFLFDGLLRGDAATRGDVHQKAIYGGWMNQNEVRALENMNSVGPEGDRYYMPVNMVPIDKIDEQIDAKLSPDPSQAPPVKEEKALSPVETRRKAGTVEGRVRLASTYERLFVDAMGRVVTAEVKAGKRAVKKHLAMGQVENLSEWLAEFYEKQPRDTRKALTPVIASYAEAVGGLIAETFDAEAPMASLESFAREYVKAAGLRHARRSLNQIKALIRDTAPMELRDVLEKRLGEWADRRASWDGRLELHQASNALAHETFRLLGVRRKRWVLLCERGDSCESLSGRIVDIDEPLVRKSEMFGLYEIKRDRLHPPLRDGCVCMIEAEV